MSEWMKQFSENKNIEEFVTPILIERDNEYLPMLEKKLQQLKEVLIGCGADSYLIKECDYFKEKLCNAVSQYYQGDIGMAQKQINTLINLFSSDNHIAISNINNSMAFGGFWCDTDEVNVNFFRARCNNITTDYSSKEMLHIPFSKREIVKSERFSIPGLPCLYLGSSSYVCWIELGRPADHQFNVSPVMLDNTQSIFNLAVNIYDFIKLFNLNEEKMGENFDKSQSIKSMLRLLILSIASSYKVKDRNRSFKSEYIIPQMIMISCMKKGLSGITYYSKQVEDDLFAHLIGVNLALFAKYHKNDELSNICEHLKIADSFNFAMYKNLSVPEKYKRAKLRIDKFGDIKNIGTFSRQYPYIHTEFYKFDHYLYSYLDLKAMI